MADDGIEDAEWDDVPGNGGKLVTQSTNQRGAFNKNQDFHEGYSAGFRHGSNFNSGSNSDAKDRTAQETESPEDSASEQIGDVNVKRRTNGFEIFGKVVLGILVLLLFIGLISSGSDTSSIPEKNSPNAAELNKTEFNRLLAGGSASFSQTEPPNGVCTDNQETSWKFMNVNGELLVQFTVDREYWILWDNVEYDGQILKLISGQKTLVPSYNVKKITSPREVPFIRDDQGNWSLNNQRVYLCQSTQAPVPLPGVNPEDDNNAAAAADSAAQAAQAEAAGGNEATGAEN